MVRCIVSAVTSSGLFLLRPGVEWVSGLIILAPGFVFGAVVLAPEIPSAGSPVVRRVGIVLASLAAYYIVVLTTVWLEQTIPFWLAGGFGGSMGAFFIVGVSRIFLGSALGSISWGALLAFGAAGGMLLGGEFGPGDTAPLVIGLSVWQIGVAWALFGRSAAQQRHAADGASHRG